MTTARKPCSEPSVTVYAHRFMLDPHLECVSVEFDRPGHQPPHPNDPDGPLPWGLPCTVIVHDYATGDHPNPTAEHGTPDKLRLWCPVSDAPALADMLRSAAAQLDTLGLPYDA